MSNNNIDKEEPRQMDKLTELIGKANEQNIAVSFSIAENPSAIVVTPGFSAFTVEVKDENGKSAIGVGEAYGQYSATRAIRKAQINAMRSYYGMPDAEDEPVEDNIEEPVTHTVSETSEAETAKKVPEDVATEAAEAALKAAADAASTVSQVSTEESSEDDLPWNNPAGSGAEAPQETKAETKNAMPEPEPAPVSAEPGDAPVHTGKYRNVPDGECLISVLVTKDLDFLKKIAKTKAPTPGSVLETDKNNILAYFETHGITL